MPLGFTEKWPVTNEILRQAGRSGNAAFYPPVVVLLSLAWVMASAVHGAGDEMDIHYGRITAAAEVDVKDHTGEGALIGGTLGIATAGMWGTGSATGNAIMGSGVGAATGYAVEYFGEQRMKGTRYTVETMGEGTLHIITDQEGVDTGDCVAVEATLEHANLRRVSEVYCESATTVKEDTHLDSLAEKSAAECYQAKKALLAAEGAELIEQATRRVRALCDT